MNPALSAFLSRRLIDRGGGHRQRVLAALAAKTRLNAASPRDIEACQRERLAALLRHAAARIPFYRDKLPAPEEIGPENALEWLRRLPVIGRSTVQQEGARLCDPAPAFQADDATGGSTGTPIRFRVDRETQIARESSLMWADGLAGWSYGERIAMLWGSDRDVRGALARWKSGLRWAVENRRWFNAFDMGPGRMAEFHAAMEKFAPHLIVAYAGSVFHFARFLRQGGLRPSYPLRGIVCSAEVLTPEMRREVEDVFGRACFDRYGNREFGAIGAEDDSHDGLRLNHADCIVETDGEGRVIVTYLHNRAMPFLRYDTGDVAMLRADGRLRPVQGRRSDTIRTADGRLIHGEYFTHLLYGCPAVSQFQFVQETERDYRLLVVAPPEAVSSMEETWRGRIREQVGEGCSVVIQRVDRIPPLASGKHKFTVSLLAQPRGGSP